MKKHLMVVLGVVAAAVALSIAATASAKPGALTVVVKTLSLAYDHAGQMSTSYPGALVTGDRIFADDQDSIGGKVAGYDNEVCTVTFNGNDLCRSVAVLAGRGDIELSWLWVGRNYSATGPLHFSGIIDGGTGAFENARGTFQAKVLASGSVEVTVRVGSSGSGS